MFKERLLSALDKSESAGTGEDFNKLREIFKAKNKWNLYKIETKKNLYKSKIKAIAQNPIELEESLFKLNKYYD